MIVATTNGINSGTGGGWGIFGQPIPLRIAAIRGVDGGIGWEGFAADLHGSHEQVAAALVWGRGSVHSPA